MCHMRARTSHQLQPQSSGPYSPTLPCVPKMKQGPGWMWSISIGPKRQDPVNVGTEQKIGISLFLSPVTANSEVLRHFQILRILHKSEMTWQSPGTPLAVAQGLGDLNSSPSSATNRGGPNLRPLSGPQSFSPIKWDDKTHYLFPGWSEDLLVNVYIRGT